MQVSNLRSKVLQLAHQLKLTGISFGEAQKRAWKTIKGQSIKRSLKEGIVFFSFLNSKGEERKAKGTLNSNLFSYTPKSNRPSKIEPITINSVIKYFDLEKSAFRSFRVERILKISALQPIQESMRMAA